MLLVIAVLGVELLCEKGINDGLIPTAERHFLSAGTRIKPAQEV